MLAGRQRNAEPNLMPKGRCRTHKAHEQTPAVAAGLIDKTLTMADLVVLIDSRERAIIREKRERTLVLSN